MFPNPILSYPQTVHVFSRYVGRELGGNKNTDRLWVPKDRLGRHWIRVISQLFIFSVTVSLRGDTFIACFPFVFFIVFFSGCVVILLVLQITLNRMLGLLACR